MSIVEKRRTAPRTGLSRERIVAAAAALVDREGAQALSARRLASELGCEAMSLYHHVANMGELLDEVIDQALGSLALPPAGAPDPRKRLREMTYAYLELARARPQAFRIISTHRWRTPAEVAYQSRMIELLMSAGLKPRAALRAARLLVVYLNGAGLATVAWQLDRVRVSLQSAPASLQQLDRFVNAAEVARDLDWGLELLLRTLLPTD
jgi:AcrR family transcriptional regulator